MIIFDIGAAGSIRKNFLAMKGVSIIGFEPDPNEYERLRNKYADSNVKIFQYAVGSGGEEQLYLTTRPTCSSLLEPDLEVFYRFGKPGSSRNKRGEVYKIIDVETITLDEFATKYNLVPDFIKIDIQGAEYEVLEKSRMDGLLGAEIEVEFFPLYKNQKLFRDIDVLMSNRGYQIYGLKRNLMKINDGSKLSELLDGGCLVHADALYFKKKELCSMDECQRVAKLAASYSLNDVAKYYFPLCQVKPRFSRLMFNTMRYLKSRFGHRDKGVIVDFDEEYRI